MEKVNCLRCHFRHEDNGNCTAVGGFCTAVPAAHCLLLRQYLDTGLTPEQYENAKVIIESAFSDDTTKAERIRELLRADKDGRVAAHGHWIYHDDGVITCSECGNAESSDSYYCRYCGAKMDGDKNNASKAVN